MGKVVGLLSAPTIGGIDYQLSKFDAKIEQAKLEYTALGQAWKISVYGGVKSVTGSFECVLDSTQLGTTYPAMGISDSATVSFSVPMGGKSLAFSAVIWDVDIADTPELITVKGSYSSTGTVTWS